MIFHFFLSDNQGTQEKDQPKKEDQGGSALYSLTLYSFNVFTPFSYRTSLYSDEVHLSAANSPNQVQLPLLLLVVLRHYNVFCVCVGVLCHSLISRGGRMETLSKEFSPLSNQGNWSVHCYASHIIHVHYIYACPSQSPSPHLLPRSNQGAS